MIGHSATITLSSDAVCDIHVTDEILLNTESSPTYTIHGGSLRSQNISEDTVINK